MTLDPSALAAILGMAAATYFTRVGGWLLVRRFTPAGRLKAALDAVPGAVLASVIAPMALATGPAETAAAAITAVAAWRLPLLPAVVAGVAAVVILRWAGL